MFTKWGHLKFTQEAPIQITKNGTIQSQTKACITKSTWADEREHAA